MAVQTNKNRIKSLFFILISIASFANANFGINNSNYQEKQTILTSITGNRVNIDVGGNTNLKGSLIAAGYINDEGNFIDNNQLSLTTNTLTYSSLSSTLFSNSNSFGGGTNIGFSETYEKDKKGNLNQNTNTKINSSNLNFGTNTAYSSSKTQATIGLGNIIIKDKENSDDIATLNRDINTQTNKLYEGSVGTSVDASIDHRFFSEEGRNSIKEDIKTTSNFASILVNTALKESMSLFASDNDKGTTSLFDNLKLEEAQKQATLDFMLTHPDEAKVLNDKEASDEQRQKADNLLKEAVDYQLGIVTNNEVKIAYDTSSEKDIKGHTTNTGDIYILKNRQDNAYDEVSTLFNELSDHYDVYNHIGTDRQDSTYKTNRAEYSEYFGNIGADWLNFRYTTNNQNSLTDFSYSDANTPTVNSILNNIAYGNIDKTTGANRRVKTEEAQMLSTLKEGKTTEEQYRLNAAACALIHCADGVPKNDPNYQTLKALQNDGEIYKEEQKEILTVSNNIYMENIERALDEPFGTYYPMDDMALDIASSIPDKTFMYDIGDRVSDLYSRNVDNKYTVLTTGVVDTAAGGIGELTSYSMMVTGYGSCIPTVFGCLIGTAGVGLSYISANQITDGLYKINNYKSATPESILVLNSFDPSYNTNEQAPLNSVLTSSALLVLDMATFKGASSVYKVGEGVAKVEKAAGEASIFDVSKLPTNINVGQQGKHIVGHNNYIDGRSILNADAQTLLDGIHSGQYTIIGTGARGQPIVNFGKSIGTDAASGLQTQYGTIHYGNKGVHIVPANPTLINGN